MSGELTATNAVEKHFEVPGRPVSGSLDLLRVLWVLDHGLYRASRTTQRKLGVTAQQRFALSIIGRFPGITPGRLTQVLGVHSSTVSGILKRLERSKLVQRQSDPKDARRWRLLVTDAGRRVTDADLRGTVEAAVDAVLAQMPAGKTAVAREVLTALVDTLESDGKARSPLSLVLATGT